MILDFYKIFSIFLTSLILIHLFLGIDIEIKPFKYSLKNLLK